MATKPPPSVLTRRAELRAVRGYMKANGGTLMSPSGYPNTLKAARRGKVRSPAGVLLHSPRDTYEQYHGIPEMQNQCVPCASMRIYVLWFDESFEQIIETMEWLKEWFPRHERCIINLQGK